MNRVEEAIEKDSLVHGLFFTREYLQGVLFILANASSAW